MTKLTCIAPHCTASAKTNKDLKFHRLPCDKIRREEWIILCQRLDLINESKDFFKDKSVCSLHFEKSMYGNKKLKRLATPSPSLIGTFQNYQDSSTQTCESIKFVQPTLIKIESPEVTTLDTQTEDVFLCAKTENDNIDTQFEEHKMECNETKIGVVFTVKEEGAKPQDLKTNKNAKTSTDSEDESEDEMSIDEFLQTNGELENEIREVLNKKNIPQTPMNNSKANLPVFYQDSSTQTCESIKLVQPTLIKIESPEVTTLDTQTEDVFLCAKTENDNIDTQFEEHKMECNETKIGVVFTVKEEGVKPQDLKTNKNAKTSTDSEDESEDEMSIDEFLQVNGELENEIREVLNKKNIPQIPMNNSKATSNLPVFLINKEVQTDDVTVYDIPKNNMCFQQCSRCGQNLNRLNLDLKPDRLVTLEEFESACERFLSPTFRKIVRNQIKLEQLLNKADPRIKDRRYVVFN